MSNPVLNEGMFQKTSYVSSTDRMTTNGAVMKTLILGLVFSIAAFLVYGYLDANIQDNQIPFIPYVVVPSIVAFVVALIISFKPATAPFLSVIYSSHGSYNNECIVLALGMPLNLNKIEAAPVKAHAATLFISIPDRFNISNIIVVFPDPAIPVNSYTKSDPYFI